MRRTDFMYSHKREKKKSQKKKTFFSFPIFDF